MASTSNLPEDVVIEILARLPVKSLIRFRCVCKSFYAVIRNPNFITKHLNHASSNNNNARILLKHNISHKPVVSLLSNETPDVSVDVAMPFFDDDLFNIIFYGPCDGLICLHIFARGPPQNCDNQIALWNPATREFKALPISGVPRPDNVGVLGTEIGFGLDFRTNDYKVVKILDFFHLETGSFAYPPQVEVYNLSTDSWRKIDTVLPTSVRATLSFSAYLNGFYYWWAGDDDGVLSFDMGDEVFQMIPPPPDMDNYCHVTLVKFNGSIALITDNIEKPAYDIWVMNGDGVDQTWTKQLTIVHPPEFYSLLGILRNGEALVQVIDGQCALYDPITQKLKNLLLPASAIPRLCQVFFYTESLVSVKGGNELHQQDNLCDMVSNPIFIQSFENQAPARGCLKLILSNNELEGNEGE